MGGLRGSPVPGFRDRYFRHFAFRAAREKNNGENPFPCRPCGLSRPSPEALCTGTGRDFPRARPRSRTGAAGLFVPVGAASRACPGQYARISVSAFFFTSRNSPNSASKRSRSMPMAAIASFALTVMRSRIAPSL